MHARDRARRAAQQPLAGVGEGHDRPAYVILDAARDQTHDALMPARVEQAEAVAPRPLQLGRIAQAAHRGERLLLHPGLDRAALLVELVETGRERLRFGR